MTLTAEFLIVNSPFAVQTMNIMMVYQSVIDLFGSFFTLLTAVVVVDGTRMSPQSIYDQFVCHIWLAKQPLWYFINTSTYGMLTTALDRYVAVIYPVWYNNNVSTVTYILSRTVSQLLQANSTITTI